MDDDWMTDLNEQDEISEEELKAMLRSLAMNTQF